MKLKILLLGILCMAGVAQGQGRHFKTDILRDTFGFTDATPAAVKMSELVQGCPSRDCIQALDGPPLIGVADAKYLKDSDLVMAVTVAGKTHVYPTRILVHHELVNDVVAGTPVAITFCPLCGSGAAYDRRMDGKTTTFGVAGVLHNSDMVFYDHATNTLWAQVTGEALMGEKTGSKLTPIPVAMAQWGNFKATHPHARVLSTNTGFQVDYTQQHYSEYETSDKIFFPVSARDARLHVKEIVYGTVIDGTPVAYTDTWIAQAQHTDTVGKVPVSIGRNIDGSVAATRTDTGTALVLIRAYWFAWYTFHTNTLLRAKEPPKHRS